jgi:hypothetical protein
MPLIQSGTQIWTFRDVVDYVLDSHEIERTPLDERRARAAVLQVYRDMPAKHCWSYYYRQRLMQTVASYSTGTVVYDHTGGAHERLLTLTTGTWPSWGTYGRVIIDEVHYEVEERKSDSLLTLKSDSNPGADVASTTYEIYRSAYPLPTDFRKVNRLWDVDENRQLPVVDPTQHHAALQVFYETPSTPWHTTIRSTGQYLGDLELVFGPPPNAIKTYDLLYEVKARRLDPTNEYTSGTVSCSASTAVTGSNTTFPTNCVGAIIRFSGNSTPPTGLLGSVDGNDNPYVEQGVIKTRTSATAVVLEEAISSTLSGVGFTISDPVDIETGAMLTAFLKAAEAEFAERAGRKDWPAKREAARAELCYAMEADLRVDNLPRPAIYDPFKHGTESTSD